MAYNEEFETRIRKVVSGWQNTEDKKMFGGICHLQYGNMFCGVYKDYLILRLGPDKAGDMMKRPHVRPFDITGRPMNGWVMVTEDGFKRDKELKNWLELTRRFVETLPAK
ncbi:MAG: TfoX/Sxy family protein [Desulfobacterales bacterium]|jgi:TfoX/Sxy family transcriptional regulator of competence genes